MNKELLRLEAESKAKAQSNAESFDAVLAEMRELADAARPTIAEIRPSSAFLAVGVKAVSILLDRVDDWRDRLAAAHSAEVAELRDRLDRSGIDARDYRHLSIESAKRAGRAVGLLRKCRDEFAGIPHSLGYEFTHLPEIDAFLSEQAGEQENGDG